MKKYFLIAVLTILSVSNFLMAQTMVSTDPQPRNVILEEFTGIHCGFCPDGHKRAAELAANNPGRVFLVNIHAGGYATPQTGEPDLRTTEGSQIDAAAGVAGYPAGTVNRGTTPWAKDRGQWATLAAGILNQTSPVNVAVKSYVDFTTRELVTEVEYYYTSASSQPTNYLTVMLTQSNILGYQSDYGNYNPTNWTTDGKYRHNHALRMVLTSGGAFGEAIDTTTEGHFGYRKYVTPLPEDIKDLDVVLYNLHVVAFVAEGQGNIYSGAGDDVEFDENLRADLSLTNMTEFPTELCFTSINPKIEVTNNSGQAVNSFDVSLFINGEETVKSYSEPSGGLEPGEKTIIDWGEVELIPTGSYSIAIQGFKNINGNTLIDMDFSNDAIVYSGVGFQKKAFSMFTAGFNLTTLPYHVAFDFSENNGFKIPLFQNDPSYGANNSRYAVMFYLHSSWGLSGKPGNIFMGEANLSVIDAPYLSYYYAYSDGGLGGTAPTVKVSVSEDCGITWNEISSETLAETGQPADANSLYIPKSAEYKKININLNEYKEKDVLFKISGIPGASGNAMYIDEITIGEDPTDVEESSEVEYLTLYPNPAEFELFFNNDSFIGKEFSVYSLLGEVVAKGVNNDNKIDISRLSKGSYIIRINNEVFNFIKK